MSKEPISRKQKKLKHRSALVFTAIFIIASLFLTWFCVRLIHSTKLNIASELQLELARIERGFIDRIDHTQSIIRTINYRISSNPKNKQHIEKILSSYAANPNLSNSFSWTAFSWVDSRHYLTVDALDGIIKNKIDLSARDYLNMAEKNPGKFYLGTPAIGAVSKKWMIPGGVGMTNNGKYVGATVIGFKIKDLATVLRRVVRHHEIGFKIFSQNGAYILHGDSRSREARNSQDDSTNNIKLEKIFNKINSTNQREFSSISLFQNRHALALRKLEGHPYIIVVSYNKDHMFKKLVEVASSRLTELFSILFAFAVLLLLIYREIKQTKSLFRVRLMAERANNSKAEFLTRATHEFKNFIFGIHGCAEIVRSDLKRISESLKKEGNPKYSYHLNDLETDLELTSNIIDTSHDLDIFINELIELNLLRNNNLHIKASHTPTDLEQVVNSILPTLKRRSKSSEVILIIDIDKDLHKLPNLDPKRIKQIIAGLVYNSIKYSKSATTVAVSLKNITDKEALQTIYKTHGIRKTKAVEILIKDQNAHINHYEIKSGLNHIKNLKKFDIFSTKLPTIKFLIEKQDGIFEIRTNRRTGNETRVIF